jgi:hypothetical protein
LFRAIIRPNTFVRQLVVDVRQHSSPSGFRSVEKSPVAPSLTRQKQHSQSSGAQPPVWAAGVSPSALSLPLTFQMTAAGKLSVPLDGRWGTCQAPAPDVRTLTCAFRNVGSPCSPPRGSPGELHYKPRLCSTDWPRHDGGLANHVASPCSIGSNGSMGWIGRGHTLSRRQCCRGSWILRFRGPPTRWHHPPVSGISIPFQIPAALGPFVFVFRSLFSCFISPPVRSSRL